MGMILQLVAVGYCLIIVDCILSSTKSNFVDFTQQVRFIISGFALKICEKTCFIQFIGMLFTFAYWYAGITLVTFLLPINFASVLMLCVTVNYNRLSPDPQCVCMYKELLLRIV